MKKKEIIVNFKKEYDEINSRELTDEDLEEVTGGTYEMQKATSIQCPECGKQILFSMYSLINARKLMCYHCGLELYLR